MTSISKAGLGQYVLLTEAVLAMFGVNLPDGSVLEALNGLVIFLALVLTIIGQFTRKDLSLGIFRKS